jgi:hypothetical protein
MDGRRLPRLGVTGTEPGVQADSSVAPKVEFLDRVPELRIFKSVSVTVGPHWSAFDGPETARRMLRRPRNGPAHAATAQSARQEARYKPFAGNGERDSMTAPRGSAVRPSPGHPDDLPVAQVIGRFAGPWQRAALSVVDRGWPSLGRASRTGVHGSILVFESPGVAASGTVDGVGRVGEQSPLVGSTRTVDHGRNGGQGVGLAGVVVSPDPGVPVAASGFDPPGLVQLEPDVAAGGQSCRVSVRRTEVMTRACLRHKIQGG